MYIYSEKIGYKIIIPKEESKMIECYFIPSNNTSSATICSSCGQEKFLHTIGEGIKVSTYIVNPKEEPKQETLKNPIIIVRNDDKEEFIHLSNGMYRTKWGILNNSISKTPLEAFDKTKFTFYYE